MTERNSASDVVDQAVHGRMAERVRSSSVLDLLEFSQAEEDDSLFRPWKFALENHSPPPELQLIFTNGDSRSLPYSDQKGVWHSGDTIVIKYIEEHVLYLAIEGQNLRELARALMHRRVEFIEAIDEERAAAIERHPDFAEKNVFSLRLIKRRWGEECEFDECF